MSSVTATLTASGQGASALTLWTGRVLFGIVVLFLAFDAAVKLLMLPVAVEGTTQLGFAAGVILPLGIIQLIALIAYVVPRTSVFGAVLWTAYLGGAVATHVRLGNPVFTHMLSPVYVAVLLWGALYLRDMRVRALIQ
jgi:hypothetical protein